MTYRPAIEIAWFNMIQLIYITFTVVLMTDNSYSMLPIPQSNVQCYYVNDRKNINCLLNSSRTDVHRVDEEILLPPGQFIPVDKQCQMLYGSRSFYCAVCWPFHSSKARPTFWNITEIKFYFVSADHRQHCFVSVLFQTSVHATRKPCCRKETARCRSYSFQFTVLQQ